MTAIHIDKIISNNSTREAFKSMFLLYASDVLLEHRRGLPVAAPAPWVFVRVSVEVDADPNPLRVFTQQWTLSNVPSEAYFLPDESRRRAV
jgi:ABC-type uncharacterized transport system substrate-binding protein